jgi:hypothetical protein
MKNPGIFIGRVQVIVFDQRLEELKTLDYID